MKTWDKIKHTNNIFIYNYKRYWKVNKNVNNIFDKQGPSTTTNEKKLTNTLWYL